jgi:hypothetical protein
MRIYDLRDAETRVFAFEVEIPRGGRRGLCRIVKAIPNAVLIRKRKFLSWFREASFCEFTVDGELYEAEEPFGDNSRYWIGPQAPRWLPQTAKVRDVFERW